MSHRLILPFAAICFLASCASLLPTDEPAGIVRGPFATRNQQPMALTLMAFRPRSAKTIEKGEWGGAVNVAWSSIEEINRFGDASPTESVAFDGETVRTTLRARHGVSESLDLEVELPFLWAGSGGLDSFIEDFHELFNLPSGARETYPDDEFDMHVVSNGDELYSLEGNSLQVQDIPIFLTWQFADESEGAPAVAARFGLEIPTGSESDGFGNGAWDFGAGVIAEKSLGRWTVIGGFDWVFPGQSDKMKSAAGDHHYDPMLALDLGGEYRWNDVLSIIVSTVWTSRMLHSVELEEVNREVFDLGWGFAWDASIGGRFMLSMHEDLVAATGSDLSVHFVWSVNL
ncbi:MAG: hypothetical protein ACI8X5_001274 [Planctomycetota bacterium]|jgi:hypothetical protein